MRLSTLCFFVMAIALLGGANLGCFVLDELDAGDKEMDRYSKNRKKVEETERTPEEEPGERDLGIYQDKLSESWGQTKSLSPGELDESIVRCNVAGKAQFMSKDECMSRGGRPSRPTG